MAKCFYNSCCFSNRIFSVLGLRLLYNVHWFLKGNLSETEIANWTEIGVGGLLLFRPAVCSLPRIIIIRSTNGKTRVKPLSKNITDSNQWQLWRGMNETIWNGMARICVSHDTTSETGTRYKHTLSKSRPPTCYRLIILQDQQCIHIVRNVGHPSLTIKKSVSSIFRVFIFQLENTHHMRHYSYRRKCRPLDLLSLGDQNEVVQNGDDAHNHDEIDPPARLNWPSIGTFRNEQLDQTPRSRYPVVPDGWSTRGDPRAQWW